MNRSACDLSVPKYYPRETANSMDFITGILSLMVAVLLFAFMELTAWFMHKYVMHGFLWILHEDHHRYHERWLEKNDAFTVFFSLIAVMLLYWGTRHEAFSLIAAGTGVTLYGVCYFLFHDIMFHRRIRFLKLKPWTGYLKRIVSAHAIHHQSFHQKQPVAFGFLFASSKYDTVIDASRRLSGSVAQP